MKDSMPDDHIDKEQFLLEFFGNFGRELGDPDQHFTEEPMEVFPFIEHCTRDKKPAFISVNPRVSHDNVLGIEKLFFDFDYGKKSDKFTDEQIEVKKKELLNEVKIFLAQLSKAHIAPLTVRTRKGFHVYIFLDKIYQVRGNDFELLDETYYQLMMMFLTNNRHTYKYIDGSVLHDSKRMCRIPTSIHEKSGEECYLVKCISDDGKIVKDKLRSLEFFKNQGIREDTWIFAVGKAFDKLQKEKEEAERHQREKKDGWEMTHGFVGSLRYCFQKAMDSGEGGHQLRLALELEAYWAGYKTVESMIDIFRKFHDFDEKTTRTQIEWFFKNKVSEIERSGKWKPYKCSTLEDLNICCKSSCPIYQRRKEKKESKNV
jgi:hypothetical protein